ncbi:Hpt domain-containing protein [Marinibaculum pumilum]|uniref:Hpt domain-containing protein n=1 Tax=Marinibaculum pumilum TaxID=1766165 RepID=A0ABV7L8R0_9PROT
MGEIDAEVLDISQLRQFTAGEPALELEIAELFAETSAGYVAAMVPDASDKAWHEAAHSLKGSARGIGAGRVAQLAASAENLVGAEAVPERRAEAQAALSQAVADVVAALGRLTEGARG